MKQSLTKNHYQLATALLAVALFFAGSSLAHAATEYVIGDTSAGENQPGWLFNRDTNTDTPYEFNTDAFSIGAGSLYVLPIGATAADKFVAENFINTLVANVNTISYDFKLGAGDDANEEQFYMNVYANFGESDDLKFYDCRYNVVPTVGSVAGFTTVTFDPTQAYPVATRGGASASPYPCPAVPADMDLSSPGSNIRMFALNVGDTSANDVNVDGYLDKVVVDLDTVDTTYDFEETVPLTDEDGDGVMSDVDKCEGTTADVFPKYGDKTAKNRWMLNANDVWETNAKPGTMGGFAPTIAGTYGCSGEQILEAMSEATSLDFGGEYKFGITKGTLEAWMAGTYYIGPVLRETVIVAADDVDGVASATTLKAEADYTLVARGTANAGDGIDFDADYSFRAVSSLDWTDAVSTYEYYGDTLLDLMVNGGFVTWGDGTFAADHEYAYAMTGTGAPVTLGVYDVYFPGNTGSLSVDIIEDTWVDLW